MDWIQFVFLIISMGGMFAWLKSDLNHFHAEACADRRDILNLIRSIQEEIKDFHGRLERQDAEFKAHLHYHNALDKNSLK